MALTCCHIAVSLGHRPHTCLRLLGPPDRQGRLDGRSEGTGKVKEQLAAAQQEVQELRQQLKVRAPA